MWGLAKLAALFAAGLAATALLGSELQRRAIESRPVNRSYAPAAEATVDPHGWPAEHGSADQRAPERPFGRSRPEG